MKVNHENTQIEEIINDLVLTCVKFELPHRIVTHPSHFAYEIEINNKTKKGVVLKLADRPFFIESTDPHTWKLNNKTIQNPYVCCDNIYIHIVNKEENYFCIHHNYFHDEILSYLH